MLGYVAPFDRSIDICAVPEEIERDHIQRAVNILTVLAGERPLGWMTPPPARIRGRLIVEAGGFLYPAIRPLMNYPADPLFASGQRQPLRRKQWPFDRQ